MFALFAFGVVLVVYVGMIIWSEFFEEKYYNYTHSMTKQQRKRLNKVKEDAAVLHHKFLSMKEKERRFLNPTDEELCYDLALLELKAIEMACGLWEPIMEEKITPAEVRKTMIIPPEMAQVHVMDQGDPVREIPITEPEWNIEEILHPEIREEVIAGWKPVEGFVP